MGKNAPRPISDISKLAPGPKPSPAATKGGTGQPGSQNPLLAAVAVGKPLYNPAGKIDPFEPLFRDKPSPEKVKKSKRKRRVPRTPLERIDISQLKLVGIILAASGNRALVEESSGKGYVIKKGTYIGTNAGKVTAIEKDAVIVEEEYEDVFGKLKVQKKELKLPKPPGEL
jgi:type IV pilus assembly protein PilP